MDEEKILEQLDRAKDQLSSLRDQQDEVERAKCDLEEIQVQKGEVEQERFEVRDEVKKALSVIEREENETRTVLEDMGDTREELTEILKELDQLEKQKSGHGDVRERITLEREHVQRAGEAMERARHRLSVLRGGGPRGLFQGSGFHMPGLITMADGFKAGVGFFAAGCGIAIILFILWRLFAG